MAYNPKGCYDWSVRTDIPEVRELLEKQGQNKKVTLQGEDFTKISEVLSLSHNQTKLADFVNNDAAVDAFCRDVEIVAERIRLKAAKRGKRLTFPGRRVISVHFEPGGVSEAEFQDWLIAREKYREAETARRLGYK